MPTTILRVKDPDTGHEVTVPARFAEQHKLEALDKPALDDNGRPLPGKPHVELEKAQSDAAGSGTPETDPATSSTTTDQTPSTENASASSAGTDTASGSGSRAGKAATR